MFKFITTFVTNQEMKVTIGSHHQRKNTALKEVKKLEPTE